MRRASRSTAPEALCVAKRRATAVHLRRGGPCAARDGAKRRCRGRRLIARSPPFAAAPAAWSPSAWRTARSRFSIRPGNACPVGRACRPAFRDRLRLRVGNRTRRRRQRLSGRRGRPVASRRGTTSARGRVVDRPAIGRSFASWRADCTAPWASAAMQRATSSSRNSSAPGSSTSPAWSADPAIPAISVASAGPPRATSWPASPRRDPLIEFLKTEPDFVAEMKATIAAASLDLAARNPGIQPRLPDRARRDAPVRRDQALGAVRSPMAW